MQRHKFPGSWCHWRDTETGHTCLVHQSTDGQWYGVKFDLPENPNKHPKVIRMRHRVALWQLKHPHMADDWPIIRSIGMESLRGYLNACAEKARRHPVHIMFPPGIEP